MAAPLIEVKLQQCVGCSNMQVTDCGICPPCSNKLTSDQLSLWRNEYRRALDDIRVYVLQRFLQAEQQYKHQRGTNDSAQT